jgi:hypothetical protein
VTIASRMEGRHDLCRLSLSVSPGCS